uniref:Uncharacterized protein n=1 Tax=Arundo donax TaxID=35708 RepID=A0A0A8XVJ6_ARUDO
MEVAMVWEATMDRWPWRRESTGREAAGSGWRSRWTRVLSIPRHEAFCLFCGDSEDTFSMPPVCNLWDSNSTCISKFGGNRENEKNKPSMGLV